MSKNHPTPEEILEYYRVHRPELLESEHEETDAQVQADRESDSR